MDPAVVLFDGVCKFCNASVTFILDHDPHNRIRFASLQSPAGQSLLERHRLDRTRLDTLVLIAGRHAYTKSDAVLQVARRLGGPWSWGFLFLVIPRPWRDWAYELLARNRYRWFGRLEHCRIPTAAERARFVDDVAGPA